MKVGWQGSQCLIGWVVELQRCLQLVYFQPPFRHVFLNLVHDYLLTVSLVETSTDFLVTLKSGNWYQRNACWCIHNGWSKSKYCGNVLLLMHYHSYSNLIMCLGVLFLVVMCGFYVYDCNWIWAFKIGSSIYELMCGELVTGFISCVRWVFLCCYYYAGVCSNIV